MKRRKIDMVRAFNVVVDNRLESPLNHVINRNVSSDIRSRATQDIRNKPLTVARSIMPVIIGEILNKKKKKEQTRS